MTPKKEKELTYIEKVWHTVAIVALLVVVILIARVAFNVLLMVLSGALIATYFHGLGDLIERNTKMPRRYAMIISVVGSFLIVAGLFYLMGTTIQHQITLLKDTLPHTINNFKAKLASNPTGQQILDYFSGDNDPDKVVVTVQHFFSTSFGVLGDIYIILFLSIFFTTNPDVYKNGILMLLSDQKKPLGQDIIDRISLSLKGWIKGMLLSMVLLGLLLTTGLSIMGIPAALILALFAGMLKIIPNLGSVIAMIPGVLLALTVGTNTAIIVALIYVVSQTIVSNIVVPIVQNRMINLPPALTIISQVVMGTLSGVLGIILAVPIVAIIVILVDELYVKKLGDAEVIAH
ncbi:AI-2E family transporter [Mucilaginibacter rubeus]|uniref:AI-2E family transporter n=1 Tax=Mucilaginibacter rubeus TaxID=2027860 RepID=A0AAE6JGP9_9SPHI|nr:MULTISPECIES: AI-2E family transporter [Mucilaginibacter]QEM04442.1 AI-2E family transporter [Mucilaginibacter rubeus]QEM17038.1 AI-2E family transporter [Mucilaginibacter gossypii]QTE46465.1 AI-2E family transporter [Mucilaginibacter rubeus]QTE53062.1 AI-2E family transporter [Mucilaginibacter rubeus]QTE58149.1 AI-2E family transporter [Mucilaginibacter rubeus]